MGFRSDDYDDDDDDDDDDYGNDDYLILPNLRQPHIQLDRHIA